MKSNRLVMLLCWAIVSWPSVAKEKPNVIVVLADDIGVGDISFYRRMHSDNIVLETPNIDRVASSGVVFTQAHAPAALCAPSRYGIMTGNSCYRSPFPWGVWGAYEKSPVLDSDLTLGRLMQKAGYHTAFFGKWHLGGDFIRKSEPGIIYRGPRKPAEVDIDLTKMIDGPNQKGFDYSFTYPAGIQDVPYVVFENGNWFKLGEDSEIGYISKEYMLKKNVKLDKSEGLGDLNWDPHNAGPLLVGKGVEYIREHAHNEKPFFMYYCSQAVHLPHTPPSELNGVKIAGTTPSAHMDMIKELDVQMGMLIDELKKQGIYENTFFIFTSDNGGLYTDRKTLASGHNPSDIYRGSKNDEHEGGHRVPFIVSWPGQLKGGQQTNEPVLGLDIAATLAAVVGENIPANQAMDSYNLMPLLRKGKKLDRDYLMLQSGTGRQLIIIEDGWKLIIQLDQKDKTDMLRTPVELYNLKENPTEKAEENLINSLDQQERIVHLMKKYNQTRESKVRTGS